MATYGAAETGLADLVKKRTRDQYGVPTDATIPDLVPQGENQTGPYVPPEDGGFTGGGLPELPSVDPPTTYAMPPPINTSISPPGQTNTSVEDQLRAAGIPGPWMTQGTSTTASTVPGAPAAPSTPATIADAYRTTLLQKLNSPIQASITDPALAAQSDAYSVGQQRARDQNREAVAERMAANGISDSGAMDQAVQGLYQQQGENQGSYNAKLVGDELTRQRDELQSYMTMAGARLTAQESMALQAKIAELNAQIAAQGQTNQVNQYNSSMGWNMTQWQALQDWLAQNAMMG